MKYSSTRGSKKTLSAAEAIIRGIAEDGGLFMPETLPQIDGDFIKELLPLTYQARAIKVLEKFLTDYTQEELRLCVENAYRPETFDCVAIAPTVDFGAKYEMLELWHGPTSAFKDMALQLLPQLMSVALKKTGETAEIVILVATSGDTGKAALEGFKDVEQIRIMVFYPQEGVSRMQRLQMVTQQGGNVSVVAVSGNFDDAQTGVKQIFNDAGFNQDLAANGFQLSSANSINWGRLAPQIVYYFSAYADLVNTKKIALGDFVNFTVPTGNFGNILAGYYAKCMGLPVRKLICASNENNVLTDFLRTGVYNRNRAFHKTNTPSMDILISSNLERLLYLICGDAVQVKVWMEALQAHGEYKIGEAHLQRMQETFWADWADDQKTCETIQSVYKAHHYVMDTHTAVAWAVAESYEGITGDTTPMVVVSTASPYKFNESVLVALAVETVQGDDAFAMLAALEDVNAVKAPPSLKNLRTAAVLHEKSCGKGEMMRAVRQFLR